jgi:uroporphyrinogen III methyltransferase / synthase
MTRFRKPAGSAGRVVFVGAGPGDPGMLTARATAALAEAALGRRPGRGPERPPRG